MAIKLISAAILAARTLDGLSSGQLDVEDED
jgi:hypothetical protein